MAPDLGKKLQECFVPFKIVELVKLANFSTVMCDTLRPKKWRRLLLREIKSPRILSFYGRSG